MPTVNRGDLRIPPTHYVVQARKRYSDDPWITINPRSQFCDADGRFAFSATAAYEATLLELLLNGRVEARVEPAKGETP